jgi:cell division protein FtsB
VRWDRIQRVALLLVLAGVVMLYIGPARSYLQTWRESNARAAQLHRAQAENHRLIARRRALRDPRSLEREARELGMVKPGERAFVIQNAPQPKH